MTRLERSYTGPGAHWIALGPERDARDGVQRIEARFAGHTYDPHRHDTYSLGHTISGVQSFDYRSARRDSLPGRAIMLYPDEVHDGRAGTDEGFRYRMLYLEPALVRAALGERASSLPFVDGAVLDDPVLLGWIEAALDDLSRPLEPLELDQVVLELSEAMLRLDPGARSSRHGASMRTSARAVETVRELLDAEATRGVHSAELERATGIDSLGEAAIACGFADQSHMTRAFGRAYGVSPGRWRRLARTADLLSAI